MTAVLVTRGDRDLRGIRASLRSFGEILVWDNSKRENLKVYGRFAGARLARNQVIYVQDDDCLVDVESLVEAYTPGQIACTMPAINWDHYRTTRVSLIGFGAIFHKARLEVFDRYLAMYPRDELFDRECDRVFTYLNRKRVRLVVDSSYRSLPCATAGNRMNREARHFPDLEAILGRLHKVEAGGKRRG